MAKQSAEHEWNRGRVKRKGLARFVHIIRADDDPDRSPREERRGKETEWQKAFGKGTDDAWAEAILNHLSDDVPRTFNRIMVEIADATADVVFEKGPDRALWNLVETYQLEFINEAPILFRRPPGWKDHYAGSDHTSLTACSRLPSLYPKTGERSHRNWDKVTCPACLHRREEFEIDQQANERQALEDQQRHKQEDETMGMKRRPKGPQANPHLEASAATLITNALIAARNRGQRLVQGDCGYCKGGSEPKTCCLQCAIIMYRDLSFDTDEAGIAKIFGLPERWLLDVLAGFDENGDTPCYKSGKRLGRKLWRKFGGQS
jgi:hypothetical protein